MYSMIQKAGHLAMEPPASCSARRPPRPLKRGTRFQRRTRHVHLPRAHLGRHTSWRRGGGMHFGLEDGVLTGHRGR